MVLLLWQLGCDSSPFAHALQCVAMSAVCLFVNAAVFRTSSVGIACRMLAATQLLVVTISFVVAANTMILKPFNTAMGR